MKAKINDDLLELRYVCSALISLNYFIFHLISIPSITSYLYCSYYRLIDNFSCHCFSSDY